MRIILLISSCILLFGCKHYKDPDPFSDDRINKHYCNDPSAINFNWDFPGIPDNTVCIYPAQIFSGNYFYRDSILGKDLSVLGVDSFPITVTQIDSTRLKILGLCGTEFYTAKANRFFQFTLDTVVGNGQQFCNPLDTISGNGKKFSIADTSTIKLSYQLLSDTGISYHSGTAIKL